MSRPGAGNTLRIVGGRWRSRRIRFTDGEGLRPTPDRVRETLFNWLQAEIVGAVCLDAFAGSGVLGFEAMSRGAGRVVMLEKNAGQYRALQQAAGELQAENMAIVCGDTLSLLRQKSAWLPAEGFDGVFLDPPFHRSLLPETCALLHEQSLLKQNSFVYVESEAEWDDLELAPQYVLQKKTRAGQVQAYLARYSRSQ